MVIEFETMTPDKDDISMLSQSIGKAWDEDISAPPRRPKPRVRVMAMNTKPMMWWRITISGIPLGFD